MYARVSNSENEKNLEKQAERLITWYNAQGWSVAKVIKACGSGINDQRPKFLALLADPKSAKSWSNTKTGLHALGSLLFRHCLPCRDVNW